MQRGKSYAEMPGIEIEGMTFELRMSDGDVYAAGRRVLEDCARLRVIDEFAVKDMIWRICGLIDDALGDGAMAKIAGGRAVTLMFALSVLNVIVQTCAARYQEYIRHEYIPARSSK